MKYFYSLGITRPNQDPRYLLNEVSFGHAGQDNNVFIYMVPRIKTVDENNNQFFLQNSQKNAIISAMNEIKGVNLELIPSDPVYTAFSLGLQTSGETLTPEISNTTFLVIEKNTDTRTNVNQIKNDINSIFQSYFAPENCELGKFISLSELTTKILSVNGVGNYSMRRILASGAVINSNGLSLLVFNPNYSDVDIQITASDIQLPYFKFPYLYNKTILNNIIVE